MEQGQIGKDLRRLASQSEAAEGEVIRLATISG